MGEDRSIKLTIIRRDAEHAGVLASSGRDIVGYSSIYEGWTEDTKNMQLFEVPERGTEQDNFCPWFRESLPRGKISLGYFVGRIEDQFDFSQKHYEGLIKVVQVPEKNKVLRDAKQVCEQLAKDCEDFALRGYLEAMISDVTEKLQSNGLTSTLRGKAENLALDIFYRSLKVAGALEAIKYFSFLTARLSEHELLRRGESDTYQRFKLIRDKIGVWNYSLGREEQAKLGLLVMEGILSEKDVADLNR